MLLNFTDISNHIYKWHIYYFETNITYRLAMTVKLVALY